MIRLVMLLGSVATVSLAAFGTAEVYNNGKQDIMYHLVMLSGPVVASVSFKLKLWHLNKKLQFM